MNVLRLLVLGLVAVLLAVFANLATAGMIPQSPIQLNKLVQDTTMNRVTEASFKYPAAVDLKVEREEKTRQTQLQKEWHEKAKYQLPPIPLPANHPPTLNLEVGPANNRQVKEFKFDQLHFHRTAEHLESDNLTSVYRMELHMVHSRVSTDGFPLNAAVGRFIDVVIDPQNPNAGQNADLKKLFDVYGNYDTPMAPGNKVEGLDLKKLLPAAADFQYYRYSGSLTAPQFKKDGEVADLHVWNNLAGPPAVRKDEPWLSDTPVEWVMFEKPLKVSLAQWAQYTSFIFDVDNHFGAQYSREPFEHFFAVWKQTDAHDLRYVPEPSIGSLLAIAGMIATLRMKCRG